ncbi:MAG: ATP-binding protein, partial [Sulfurimonas sp.]
MNKNKNGLKKIYLIKSAGYEFAEIALHDNTLLLGESGVGKTTIMRAVLFFYTMDYSDVTLNINPDTKKSFNDWYFKEHNSHLVYEYIKDESKFLFIVSKTGKLHYTFVDITNTALTVKELFLDGDMPLNLERLNENIQTNNLPNTTTTIKEKYINIFHKKDSDNKNIKQESTTSFVLFESINSRKEFAKTLSNIFASSKVSSNSLKKSIVSLIADSNASINLNTIKVNLNEFIKEKKEIEQFEKKFPTILKLAETHTNYKQNKNEFKIKANQLESVKKNSAIEMEENTTKLAELEKERTELKFAYEVASKISKDKISEKEKEIWRQEEEIKELSEKEVEYKQKDIDSLVVEYNNEQVYKDSLNNAKQRFNALTSGAEGIKNKYHKILENLMQDSNNNMLRTKTIAQENIGKINDKINEMIQSKETKIKESSQLYLNEKTSLDLLLETQKAILGETKVSLGKVEHFPFNKEKIDAYGNEIERFSKELSDTKLLIPNNNYEIEKVEQEIENIRLELKKAIEKLEDEVNKQKNILLTEKLQIEKKLDFESDNLYGFLNKNDIKNKEKIATYLKEEILFSDKKFRAKVSDENNSIFGLELEFDTEFSNEYEQAKLLEQLKLLKDKIKNLNKKVLEDKKIIEENAYKQTKEKNKRRTDLYSLKSNLDEKEKSYHKSLNLAKDKLVFAQIEATKQRKEEMEKLTKKYANEDLEIKKLIDSIKQAVKKIEDIQNSITQSTEEIIREYKEQIATLSASKKRDVAQIEEKYEKDAYSLQEELSCALTAEGVDEKLLKEISQEQKSLEQKLHIINKDRIFVTFYLFEYQEKIKAIPAQRAILKENESIKKSLSAELESLKSNSKKDNAAVDKRKKELDARRSDLELFIKNYAEKIENQNIKESIKNSLILENASVDNEVDIKEIVNAIVNLYENIKNNEEKIKSLVLECEKALAVDNIFKIDISNDYVDSIEYLKTAKELIAYVQKDKITTFKEMASETFKSSLNSIKKDLALFDDAIMDVKGEVLTLRNTINKAVDSFNVIDNIKIRSEDSNNNILYSLKALSRFYDENTDMFLGGLYKADINDAISKKVKGELDTKISDFVELLKTSKERIELEDGFVLEFKVTEKGNDLKWRQTLDDIGSNGTSTLVKSIINIAMLQMVSKNIV